MSEQWRQRKEQFPVAEACNSTTLALSAPLTVDWNQQGGGL